MLVGTTAIRSPEGYAATGPRFAPLVVGVLLLVLSLLFLARTVVRPDMDLAERAAREAATSDWARPALVVAALLAYAFLIEPLGYVVATALFFVATARILGSRALLRDALTGLAIALVMYVAFTQFLGVDLPAGLTPIT